MTIFWRDTYPLLSGEHAAELEARAAIKELSEGLPRHQAELSSHKEYLEGHMRRAAAHHLAGLRAAHAAGDMGAAAQHGALYGLLARALGFSAVGEPPPEVAAMARDPEHSKVYEFKPHGADALVIEHLRRRGGLAKAESEIPLTGVPVHNGRQRAWDVSHLLPPARRKAGEQLHVRDGAKRTVVHFTKDGDVHHPIETYAEDEHGGEAMPQDGQGHGDVRSAATRALRLRKLADLAGVLGKSRDVMERMEALLALTD